MSKECAGAAGLIGDTVVLDVLGQFVYIGRLTSLDDQFVELVDADVHDANESTTSKEVYLIDAKKYGVKKNRKSVFVRTSQVTSLSRLDDVIEY